jgi:hypothetical protein
MRQKSTLIGTIRKLQMFKKRCCSKFFYLRSSAPKLGRPHVDTIKGGSVKNLKELRARTRTHVLRVLFYFDDERQALLLVAGDKKGKNEKDFYTRLIQMAELLIKLYQR